MGGDKGRVGRDGDGEDARRVSALSSGGVAVLLVTINYFFFF